MPSLICPLSEARSIERVGGKALHLGELLRAGFPVPNGFVITTDAYRAGWSDAFAQSVLDFWEKMGSPRVAVRSSATAEDLDGASMAGQYDTYLNIDTEKGLLEAVRKCWASVDSERTRTYLAGLNLSPDQVAMAVVVQQQVEADVAGVLFTADPQQPRVNEMIVEASWGLGEAVVSGLVQPDLYRLDAASGKVKSLIVAEKLRWIPSGHEEEEQDVPVEKQKIACLKTADLQALWRLGRLAEKQYGGPQDIEWAISKGKLLMLQARAITTLKTQEARAQIIEEIAERLKGQSGPWVRHNLGETLPHPHPLTWSLIQRFMSGNGGYGEMYRRVGFEPGPAVADAGFLELIGGVIYMDCARSPEMFFENYPFQYDAEFLQNHPGAAQEPPTIPVGSARDRIQTNKKLIHVGKQIESLVGSLADTLRSKIIPEFEAWVAQEKQRDLSALTSEELFQCWEEREKQVFQITAPDLFLPSLVEGHLQQKLRAKLAEIFWDQDSEELLQRVSVSTVPDVTMRSNMDLEQVAQGLMSLDAWIARYGHRCPGELDIAIPRWRERPDDVRKLADLLQGGKAMDKQHPNGELELGNISVNEAQELRALLKDFQNYLSFREDGKEVLIRGCDLLRDVALEIDRRLGTGGRIFHLSAVEMGTALRTGYVPEDLLEERINRYNAESSLELPAVLLPESLGHVGNPVEESLPDGERMEALSISRGMATGTVCVVHSPEEVTELPEKYVLVCPSTDPSWTPLFVNAVAVVLERGGALSHGAVVAREMGVPAVVLPRATHRLKNGDLICVDGTRGAVIPVLDAGAVSVSVEPDPNECWFPAEMIPPVVSDHERKSGRLAAWASGLWGVFLGLVFLLPPAMLHNPLLRWMDDLLWPLVNRLGRAGALALIAVMMSSLLMVLQKGLTDNRRMVAARDRAARLREQVKSLDPQSLRRQKAEQLAKPVTMRLLVAAMVPIALLLGPLCMLFTWFPSRLVPAAQNALAGSAVTLVATVDGEWQQPVHLELEERLKLEIGSADQTLPPIRSTLETLQKQWQQSDDLSAYPWAVKAAALQTRDLMLADLSAYLRRGIPAQTLVYAQHGRVVNGVQVPCEKTAYGNIHNHHPRPTLEG